MRVHSSQTLTLSGAVIAIGAFDGIHRGHQVVINNAMKSSKILDVPSVVYTFDPPPRSCFQGAQILTPLEEKLNRLDDLQVDHAVVARFDHDFVNRSPASFIEELSRLKPKEIFVGSDFRFGVNRQGDANLLSQFFNVKIVKPIYCSRGLIISSTRIRNLLLAGRSREAESLLGWLPNILIYSTIK